MITQEGKILKLQSDLSVLVCKGYGAIGSGQFAAEGALYALKPYVDALDAAKTAAAAAATISPSCSRPLYRRSLTY